MFRLVSGTRNQLLRRNGGNRAIGERTRESRMYERTRVKLRWNPTTPTFPPCEVDVRLRRGTTYSPREIRHDPKGELEELT